LVYLPLYSPDFNSIEEAFSSIKATGPDGPLIKASLRRNEALFTGPEKLPWLITQAVAGITAEMAAGWFRDCGYM
ncbi:hypothetical protein GGX14DRAFT_608791, partial [Mycena pura]